LAAQAISHDSACREVLRSDSVGLVAIGPDDLRSELARAHPCDLEASSDAASDSFPFADASLSSACCMVRKPSPGFAVLLTAAGFVVGCQGGPELARSVTIEPGKPTHVTLVQVQGQMQFVLQNESSGAAASVYSSEKANPLAKVVADEQLQALLDVFTEKGLFATSITTVPPDARDILFVEQPGRRWTWARRRAGIQEAEGDFHEAKAYFLELYNSATAYHRGTTDRPDLLSEQDRVKAEADAAKKKLENLGRKQ
jgi:hypothetical protein